MNKEGIPLVSQDLYADSYYDNHIWYNLTRSEGRTVTAEPTFNRAVFVLLLRAGLILIQLGSIPVGNTNLILLHNLLEFVVSTIAYSAVGYTLAYGRDVWRLFGTARWIGSYDARMDRAVVGWSAVVTATGIFTTMVAGRFHLAGLVIVAVIMASILDPVAIHWIWTGDGIMHKNTLSDVAVSYKDLGGCSIVHVLAGTVALFGVATLGRRLMRLGDADETSLPPGAPATCFLGYFLVTTGLIALSTPSAPAYQKIHDDHVARILMNNIMAMAGGMLVVVLLHFAVEKKVDSFHYWTMLRCMQGGVAGMVVVSAGADGYTPVVALLLGMGAGPIYLGVARALFRSQLEDYSNIIPTHLVCGLIGTLLPPVFGNNRGFTFHPEASTKQVLISVCWQVVCTGVLLLFFTVVLTPVFLLLICFGFVNNRRDERDNRRAKTVMARKGVKRTFAQRIFEPGHPPLLVVPGNESKNVKMQRVRALKDVVINRRLSQLDTTNSRDFRMGDQPMNTALQTYRVEVTTALPSPLNENNSRRLQGGDHLYDPVQGRKGSDGKESPLTVDEISKPGHGDVNAGLCGESIGLTPQSKYNETHQPNVNPCGDTSSLEFSEIQIHENHNIVHKSEPNEECRTRNDQARQYKNNPSVENEGRRIQAAQNEQSLSDDVHLRLEKEMSRSEEQSGLSLLDSNNLNVKYDIRIRDGQNEWHINDGKHVRLKREASLQNLPYVNNDLQTHSGKRLRAAKSDCNLLKSSTLGLKYHDETRNVSSTDRFHTKGRPNDNCQGISLLGNTSQNESGLDKKMTLQERNSRITSAESKTAPDENLSTQVANAVNIDADSRTEAHVVNIDSDESDSEDDPKEALRVLINRHTSEQPSWASLSEDEGNNRDADVFYRKRLVDRCDRDGEEVRSQRVRKKARSVDERSYALDTKAKEATRARKPRGHDEGVNTPARAHRGLRGVFQRLFGRGGTSSQVDDDEPDSSSGSFSSESRDTSGSGTSGSSGTSTSQSSTSQESGFCRHAIMTISECTEESSSCLDGLEASDRSLDIRQPGTGVEPADDQPASSPLTPSQVSSQVLTAVELPRSPMKRTRRP